MQDSKQTIQIDYNAECQIPGSADIQRKKVTKSAQTRLAPVQKTREKWLHWIGRLLYPNKKNNISYLNPKHWPSPLS